ncbi:MAG TPA: hypothetical protein VN442_05400 [Bryobacteraceae bacterium]|nr:hypothetical protein [Bryobacteraceae bacterium]
MPERLRTGHPVHRRRRARGGPERRLVYSREPGNLNRLPLGSVGRNLGFTDLLPHSNEFEIGEGRGILVLDLETIIAIKEELASEKDLAVLPVLYQTLRLKKSI